MKISRLTQAMYLLSCICLSGGCLVSAIPTKSKPGTAIFVMSTIKYPDTNISVVSKTNLYNTDYVSVNQKFPEFSGFSDIDFQNKLNKTIRVKTKKNANKAIAEAKEYNKDLKEDNLPLIKFEYSQNFSIIPSTFPYYTISFFTYQYGGGAHGYSKMDYINIDLSNNTIISLNDLFKPKIDYLSILNNQLKIELTKMEEKGQIVLLKDISEIGISENQAFYIDSKGNLILVFNVYEIAPYAAGIIQVIIPYSRIESYMN